MKYGYWRYWRGVEVMSAQTGETMIREVGPYVVVIEGSYWREVSREEALAYILKMHKEKPVRLELVPREKKKGKTNDQ